MTAHGWIGFEINLRMSKTPKSSWDCTSWRSVSSPCSHSATTIKSSESKNSNQIEDLKDVTSNKQQATSTKSGTKYQDVMGSMRGVIKWRACKEGWMCCHGWDWLSNRTCIPHPWQDFNSHLSSLISHVSRNPASLPSCQCSVCLGNPLGSWSKRGSLLQRYDKYSRQCKCECECGCECDSCMFPAFRFTKLMN